MTNHHSSRRALARSDGEGSLTGLTPISPTPSRLQAILDLGIDPEELADALGVTATTIRNWITGVATPRRQAVRTIDDLRQVAVALFEAGIVDQAAGQWLRSRQGGTLENDRPLDVIREDPLRVLAAASGIPIEGPQDGPDLRVVSD